MIWMFERKPDEILRIETRYENDTAEFVLIMHLPSGPHIERFKDTLAFRLRLEGLEARLTADQWTQKGSVFLRDGWKTP